MEPKELHTECVRGGEEGVSSWNVTTAPIFQSAAFSFPDLTSWQRTARGQSPGHIYSRSSNPTIQVLEKKLALLESGDASIVFSSGMAAITAIVLSFLEPGNRLMTVRDLYGGTYLLFSQILPKWGVDVRFATADEEDLLREITPETRLLFVETPSNPTLKVLDIRKIARAASEVGCMLVVDSTLATPCNQKPLLLGADLVVHSATKFLCGHGDVLAGAVMGPAHLIQPLYRMRELTGGCLDPHAAWLLIRGLKTLAIRMARHNQSALEVATFLENHPLVERVLYPGLKSHPGHHVASTQMSGFGGLLSFEVRGGYPSTRQVVNSLRLGYRAANLGSVETVFGPPALTSHVECTEEERREAGISDSLIRYSVGLEDVRDILEDLRQALEGIR